MIYLFSFLHTGTAFMVIVQFSALAGDCALAELPNRGITPVSYSDWTCTPITHAHIIIVATLHLSSSPFLLHVLVYTHPAPPSYTTLIIHPPTLYAASPSLLYHTSHHQLSSLEASYTMQPAPSTLYLSFLPYIPPTHTLTFIS